VLVTVNTDVLGLKTRPGLVLRARAPVVPFAKMTDCEEFVAFTARVEVSARTARAPYKFDINVVEATTRGAVPVTTDDVSCPVTVIEAAETAEVEGFTVNPVDIPTPCAPVVDEFTKVTNRDAFVASTVAVAVVAVVAVVAEVAVVALSARAALAT
jgi:hypothetical protein